MKTLVHISDLHFGTEEQALADALLSDIRKIAPDLVVVSGDLTQRARTKQFLAARDYLRQIPFPRIVVPGNHDVPLFDIFRRAFSPLTRYRRYISGALNPFYRDDRLAVLALNTARSLTWKEGRISVEQMTLMREKFCPLPGSLFKILVTHHPFIPPPEDAGIKLVGRSVKALEVISDCGVELLLAGHLHHGYSGDVRTRYPAARRSVVAVQAGTAISRRVREMANAYNAIELNEREVCIRVRTWQEDRFAEIRREVFRKKGKAWVKQTIML